MRTARSRRRLLGAAGASMSIVLRLTGSAQAAAPTCLDGVGAGTRENTPLPLPPAPCSDADGDPLTIIIVSGPLHGTLGPADFIGRRLYTPAVGFVGADTVMFKANDSVSDSNVATLTITVTPVRRVDTDGDGVPDVADRCPRSAGPRPTAVARHRLHPIRLHPLRPLPLS
jgi:Big-like domain-containing protein